ncbi:MAG: SDR family NAD(P)-dependent oxidoreductase [Bacteroidota bacterium]
MTKTVFITGATSGIGKACAEKFAAAGYHLILTGRRNERLAEMKTKLELTYGINIKTLNFDVQQREIVFEMINSLSDEWKKIDILINNAGLSIGRDSFLDSNLDDWETMMHTNVDGLLYVTKALLPFLIEQKAHIINMGSIAGKEIYENGNIYCASKFAVDAISRSMRVDLLKYGMRVTAIHPGAVETEFSLIRYKGDQEKADNVYKGLKPLTGDDIADIIFYAATLPKHVCLNEISVTPTQQAGTYYFHRDL